ncbi:uncharacterized protein LOC144209415 [Stigmatopora nigra]
MDDDLWDGQRHWPKGFPNCGERGHLKTKKTKCQVDWRTSRLKTLQWRALGPKRKPFALLEHAADQVSSGLEDQLFEDPPEGTKATMDDDLWDGQRHWPKGFPNCGERGHLKTKKTKCQVDWRTSRLKTLQWRALGPKRKPFALLEHAADQVSSGLEDQLFEDPPEGTKATMDDDLWDGQRHWPKGFPNCGERGHLKTKKTKCQVDWRTSRLKTLQWRALGPKRKPFALLEHAADQVSSGLEDQLFEDPPEGTKATMDDDLWDGQRHWPKGFPNCGERGHLKTKKTKCQVDWRTSRLKTLQWRALGPKRKPFALLEHAADQVSSGLEDQLFEDPPEGTKATMDDDLWDGQRHWPKGFPNCGERGHLKTKKTKCQVDWRTSRLKTLQWRALGPKRKPFALLEHAADQVSSGLEDQLFEDPPEGTKATMDDDLWDGQRHWPKGFPNCGERGHLKTKKTKCQVDWRTSRLKTLQWRALGPKRKPFALLEHAADQVSSGLEDQLFEDPPEGTKATMDDDLWDGQRHWPKGFPNCGERGHLKTKKTKCQVDWRTSRLKTLQWRALGPKRKPFALLEHAADQVSSGLEDQLFEDPPEGTKATMDDDLWDGQRHWPKGFPNCGERGHLKTKKTKCQVDWRTSRLKTLQWRALGPKRKPFALLEHAADQVSSGLEDQLFEDPPEGTKATMDDDLWDGQRHWPKGFPNCGERGHLKTKKTKCQVDWRTSRLKTLQWRALGPKRKPFALLEHAADQVSSGLEDQLFEDPPEGTKATMDDDLWDGQRHRPKGFPNCGERGHLKTKKM